MVELIKVNLERECEKIINYLDKKKAWELGFIRYNLFKRMIIHITKIKSLYSVRKIFLHLVADEIFLKKKNIVRSYLYMFRNPSTPKINKGSVTITFD